MASAGTLTSLEYASTNFVGAVEDLLEQTTECAYRNRPTSKGRRNAEEAIGEVWKKCFELGATSIKLAHEIIVFFSEPDKTNVSKVHSQYRSVVLAIEATRTRCAELQPAVKAAWRQRHSGNAFTDKSMDFIDKYFGAIEDRKVPSFETRATELARLWSSLNPEEIEITPFASDIVVMHQRHITRVCLYWLPLRPHYETAGSAALSSPLMDYLFGDCILGREDSVRVLARYSTQGTQWKSDTLTRMLGEEITSALSYLQSCDLSNLPPETSSSLSGLLRLFAKAFVSLLSAFSSTWAMEQCVHKLKILDIFPLDQDSFTALQTVPVHRECVREAILNAHTHFDAVIHLLKQLLKNPIAISHKESAYSNGSPKCVECILGNLLAYSEEELLKEILHPDGWEWATSDPSSDKSKDNVVSDFRSIFISNRLYTPSLHPQHFVDPDPDLSTISQIPPLWIDPALDTENLQLFWSQILAIATNLRRHPPLKESEPRRLVSAPASLRAKFAYRWKPCSCKAQSKFAAESKKAKEFSKTVVSGTLGVFSSGTPALTSSVPERSSAQKQGGISSLQGDWTF